MFVLSSVVRCPNEYRRSRNISSYEIIVRRLYSHRNWSTSWRCSKPVAVLFVFLSLYGNIGPEIARVNRMITSIINEAVNRALESAKIRRYP